MKEQDITSNINSDVRTRGLSLRSLGSSSLVQIIISAVITCIIEYRIFQSGHTKPTASPLAFGISLFFSFLFISFCYQTINIRIDQKKHFREDFSFCAACSVFALIISTGLGLFTGLAFWSGLEQIIKFLLNKNTAVRNISLIDYILSIAIIVILLLTFSQWHSQWQGRTSSKQYRQ